jgi:hypothetical protein
MEPEGSLPRSQDPETSPYPEQTNPVRTVRPISLLPVLILSSHLRLGLPTGVFPSALSRETLCAFLIFHMRATSNARDLSS